MKMNKIVALVLALTLVIGVAVGGTLAWLTDKTESVTNTFTPSTIKIELKEHKYDAENDKLTTEVTTTGVDNYKMIPGWDIPKDPWATVIAGSEDCYLFVKVEETGVAFTPDGDEMPMVYSFGDFMNYEIADGWTQLKDKEGKDVSGVYYRVFDSNDKSNTNKLGEAYKILKDDKVTVLTTVTEEMMEVIGADNMPKLTFTAYAAQLYMTNAPAAGETGKFSPEAAWNLVNPNP